MRAVDPRPGCWGALCAGGRPLGPRGVTGREGTRLPAISPSGPPSPRGVPVAADKPGILLGGGCTGARTENPSSTPIRVTAKCPCQRPRSPSCGGVGREAWPGASGWARWRSRGRPGHAPPDRLGTQATAGFCVQAAASRQSPTPPALPISQNRGQMSLWLRPSQAVCPAAAAQGWEPALSPIPGGCRGPLARGPELEVPSSGRAGAGGGRAWRALRPGALAIQRPPRPCSTTWAPKLQAPSTCWRQLPGNSQAGWRSQPRRPGARCRLVCSQVRRFARRALHQGGNRTPAPTLVAAEGSCQRPGSLFVGGARQESPPCGPSGQTDAIFSTV